MDMMSERDFFGTIPTQIALGNHDLELFKSGWNYSIHDDDESIEIAQGYENRFHMPQIRPPIKELASLKGFTIDGQPKDFVQYEYGNAYYSFTFGPSKHIVLSSFSSFREGSLQYDWLLSELKSVNRSITPWLIVMLHCPVYTTFKTHHKEMFVTEAQVILEPLFVDYTVNFVIAGHIHAYMRTHPMAFSRRNPRGPIHIIQGNGGKGVGQKYNNETAEEWVAMRDQSQYGYGTLELFNNTHAMWRWIKTGYDENGEFEPDLNLHDEILVMNQLYAEEIRGAANEDWEDNV
jgi:acid phosphatase type 7